MFSPSYAWFAAALLVLSSACAAEGASPSDGLAQEASAPNVGGSGGASRRAIFYDDPALRCYKLRAFASAAGKDQPYGVPTTDSVYVAFQMRAPWSGVQYVKSFRSLIDNGPLLQHWVLYRQLNGGSERVVPRTSGIHTDGEALYGWAPGGDDLWFDRDVGMEVPANAVFQLELHYVNGTGAVAPDASGVELCVTPKKPAHLAGLSWLGTDLIDGTSARGTCTPSNTVPVRLIASAPHLHAQGTHVKVERLRADGASEVVLDQPFRFDQQRAYLHDLSVAPGDRLITTCSYAAAVRFGKSAGNEVCYVFAMHWPGGALARSSLSTLIHGPNTCID